MGKFEIATSKSNFLPQVQVSVVQSSWLQDHNTFMKDKFGLGWHCPPLESDYPTLVTPCQIHIMTGNWLAIINGGKTFCWPSERDLSSNLVVCLQHNQLLLSIYRILCNAKQIPIILAL